MCGLLQLCSVCTVLFGVRGKKTGNKIHAVAKRSYNTSPIAWRRMYFYLGWVSQVTTMTQGCISSHRLQDDSLLVLNSHIGINLKHSLLLGLRSML